MSQSRTIKDYFKRPAFAQTSKYIQPSSSPLSDPPSDLPSQWVSSSQQLPDLDAEPQSNGRGALSPSHSGQLNHGSNGTFRRSSSLGGSFNSSQRIVKNGQEVVIDSDAESVSSTESLEEPDKLLDMFLGISARKKDAQSHVATNSNASSLKTKHQKNDGSHRNWRAMSEQQGKKYKFSMASLVTRAVDDDETEANVEKARASLQDHDTSTSTLHNTPESKGATPNLREDVLASALSADDRETDFQRLLNAVKRTEALEQEKSWAFFMDGTKGKVPDFPSDTIAPSSRESFLRETSTRDRAFYSGILDFALSRSLLPDEVLMWIFQAVSSEPRDELRHAYCRAIKHAEARRLESLVGPADIDQVFLNLGGSSTAIDVTERIRPEVSYKPGSSSRNWNRLLSVLELLRDIGAHLCTDTKEHALCILFRLALDTAVSNNNLVIAALESTINSLLQGIPHEMFEQTIQPIGISTFKAIKDATFQSRLLGHILPMSPQIALFRSRLAMAFLFNDQSQLEKSLEEILDLRRIINHLKEIRLDTELHKARLAGDYDYTELKATTYLLNTVIDTGRTTLTFPDKETERRFNKDVDALAEQVKKIFSAIEDSGASHLKRTEAKQGLEALRYRIIYSIRSKQQVKSIFGQEAWERNSSPQFVEWANKGNEQKGIKAESPVN